MYIWIIKIVFNESNSYLRYSHQTIGVYIYCCLSVFIRKLDNANSQFTEPSFASSSDIIIVKLSLKHRSRMGWILSSTENILLLSLLYCRHHHHQQNEFHQQEHQDNLINKFTAEQPNKLIAFLHSLFIHINITKIYTYIYIYNTWYLHLYIHRGMCLLYRVFEKYENKKKSCNI